MADDGTRKMKQLHIHIAPERWDAMREWGRARGIFHITTIARILLYQRIDQGLDAEDAEFPAADAEGQ